MLTEHLLDVRDVPVIDGPMSGLHQFPDLVESTCRQLGVGDDEEPIVFVWVTKLARICSTTGPGKAFADETCLHCASQEM